MSRRGARQNSHGRRNCRYSVAVNVKVSKRINSNGPCKRKHELQRGARHSTYGLCQTRQRLIRLQIASGCPSSGDAASTNEIIMYNEMRLRRSIPRWAGSTAEQLPLNPTSKRPYPLRPDCFFVQLEHGYRTALPRVLSRWPCCETGRHPRSGVRGSGLADRIGCCPPEICRVTLRTCLRSSGATLATMMVPLRRAQFFRSPDPQ